MRDGEPDLSQVDEKVSRSVRPASVFLSSRALFSLGQTVSLTALPMIAIIDFHCTPFQLAELTAISSAPPLVFGLSVGAVLDWINPRWIAILCGAACFLLSILLSVIVASGSSDMIPIMLVAFAFSSLQLISDVTTFRAIPLVSPSHKLEVVNSIHQASSSAAQSIGPALCGWFLQIASPALLFLSNSLTFVASSAAMAYSGNITRPQRKAKSRGHIFEILDGFVLVMGNPIQRAITISASSFNLFHAAFFSVFTFYAFHFIGIDQKHYGFVLATPGLVSAFGAVVLAPRIISFFRPRTILVASLVLIGPLGLPLLLVGPDDSQWCIVGTMAVVFGFWDFSILVNVSLEQTVYQKTIPDEYLARSMATTRFLSWGISPLGAIIGGALSTSAFGIKNTVIVTMIGMSVSGLYLLFPKEIRSLS